MSVYYRKENHRDMLFKKNNHIKASIRKTLAVMPLGFSDEDFLETYKRCFSHLWRNIMLYCFEKKQNQIRRKRKKLKTVPCLSASDYILKQAHANILNYRNQHKRGEILSREIQDSKKAALISHALSKQLVYEKRQKENLDKVQEVCPSYVKELIHSYFNVRKTNTLDVNARYLILLEACQFKCQKTIEFLHQVNSCEKNDSLRHFAYCSLQKMGEHPWLARQRKGKKKYSQIKLIDIQESPTALLQLLYSNQHLLYQNYDIFLSHSSLDVKELLEIKQRLNRQGYVVYIDWINDRVMLNRENQDENTWNVLYLRMDCSKQMIYVLTPNSVKTDSTEREVLYFKQSGKPVYYLKTNEQSVIKPAYLDGCLEYTFIN